MTTATFDSPTDGELWLKATDFFRTCRPHAHRDMRRDGSFEEVILGRVAACKRYATNLIDGGMWEGEAWNRAIRKELLESESD